MSDYFHSLFFLGRFYLYLQGLGIFSRFWLHISFKLLSMLIYRLGFIQYIIDYDY